MQIHELNNRKKAAQLNEVDLAGPNSIWNVGKEVVKNPKALLSNPAMGAAKQTAYQSSAADSAAKLANRGYTVGGNKSVAPGTNIQATQQMVKNLAAQWQQQATAVAAKIKTTPLGEAGVPITDPAKVKDPQELKVLNALYAQLMQKGSPDAELVKPTPELSTKTNQRLDAYSREFQTWADSKLRALGVDLASIERDPNALKGIQELLTNIAIEGLADPKSPRSTELVEKFFSSVIAANQALRQNKRVASVPAGKAAQPAASYDPANDIETLKKYGVSLPQTQLDSLSQGMSRAAEGGKTIRNTGNTLLNSLARLAGFQVAAT